MKNLKVLFEDNHLLAILKPPGVPTQADRTKDPDLLGMAKKYLAEKYHKKGNVYLGLLHRLDRPVGGVILFAKTSKAASRLSKQFREGIVGKSYIALVQGNVKETTGKISGYLVNAPQNKVKVFKKEKTKSRLATLSFEKMAKKNSFYPEDSLLKIYLHTGRKHQIRALLAHFGHAIIGDRKYGSRIPLKKGKIALLSHALEFDHPISGKRQRITCPLVSDWPKKW